jgi:hypothetical protein
MKVLSKQTRLMALVGILILITSDVNGQQVVLKGDRWIVSVQPQTLAVTGTPINGQPLALSLPRPNQRGIVADLQQDGRHAQWNLVTEKLAVDMRLDGDVLVVQFTAAEPGSFTWPVLGATPAQRAYIIPMFEGLYVPTDDKQWAEFLVKQGPLDTTGGLSMPFWGIDCGGSTLTYIVTNPFNNELAFGQDEAKLTAQFTHTFTANQKLKQFGLRISLGDASPVQPAKVYRDYLIRQGQFVSLKQKIEQTPAVAKLLGAAHVYLWGDGLIARNDLPDLKRLAEQIINASTKPGPSVGKRLWTLMSQDARKLLGSLPAKEWVDNYDKGQVAEELSRILELREFYDADSWKDITPPAEAQALLRAGVSTLSDSQACRLNCMLLQSAFPDILKPVDAWGDGLSRKMVQMLADAGLDRLWLGSPDWKGLRTHPEMVQQSISLGYLIGPYDSFHSIHSPNEADTWETAQFDHRLFESGPVVRQDGTKRKGFKKKGYILSPLAARPAVEKRVSDLMRQFRCNSWFIDCDATGEVFDDYSPLHPATQEDDMNARLSRMAWIRDTYKTVIGSEGASGYAAGTIHFAHGMMTPVIGWGDPDLTDHSSKYYLGGYFPPDGPAVFFNQVPMKDDYRRVYADPRFRLPLYETVFHDSVVATHQWGYGSLKFVDTDHARELLELLYNVPPLYHLNMAEWSKRKELIKTHYDFFSPLHRKIGLLPMTDFRWLSDDRMVQRTIFGSELELTANFGNESFHQGEATVAARSISARWLSTGQFSVFKP